MLYDLGNGVTTECEPGSERARILTGMGHGPVGDDGDALTVAGLRDEIDQLNSDRAEDEQISKGGSKADLTGRIADALTGPPGAGGEAPPSR